VRNPFHSIAVFLSAFLCFVLFQPCYHISVANSRNSTSRSAAFTTSLTSSGTNITKEQAQTLLENRLGKYDSDGNQYSFIFDKSVTICDIKYYSYKISWLIKDEDGNPHHWSYITNYLVSMDGTVIKEME
jgi:hypothetical protein